MVLHFSTEIFPTWLFQKPIHSAGGGTTVRSTTCNNIKGYKTSTTTKTAQNSPAYKKDNSNAKSVLAKNILKAEVVKLKILPNDLYINVQNSFICNNPQLETTQMSTNRSTDKTNWYSHTMEHQGTKYRYTHDSESQNNYAE